MVQPAVTQRDQQWQFKRGWIAVAICLIVIEGMGAGETRQCMPSFSIGILTGQLILGNMLLVPEIMALIAGVSAFFLAACPSPAIVVRRWPAVGLLILAILCVLLAEAAGGAWYAGPALGLLAGGAVVGGLLRAFPKVRPYWLPLALLIAFAAGGVIFSLGHYGQNNCWL